MKKRIEILADSIGSTSDGVELRYGEKLVAKVFVRNNLPYAFVSGIEESMAISKMSIQDSLAWILIDFYEHDEIHRAAIRLDDIDWNQVDMLMDPIFRGRGIPYHRRKATAQQDAEQDIAPSDR